MYQICSKKSKLLLILSIIFSFVSISGINADTIYINESGERSGYTWEFWKDNGTAWMNNFTRGAFRVEWVNTNNFLARKGVRPGLKTSSLTYGVDYQPGNGDSIIGAYGWSQNPLVEYYIVENWSGKRPPFFPSISLGSVYSDGGVYDVFLARRSGAPSIEGTRNFNQIWSIRHNRRSRGTITMGNHFNTWASLGIPLGQLYEVSFAIEAVDPPTSGKATVYELFYNCCSNTPPTVPSTYKLGDVNGDSFIDALDAILIRQRLKGNNPLIFNPVNADVNKSGSISYTDAVMIMGYYTGFRDGF